MSGRLTLSLSMRQEEADRWTFIQEGVEVATLIHDRTAKLWFLSYGDRTRYVSRLPSMWRAVWLLQRTDLRGSAAQQGERETG